MIPNKLNRKYYVWIVLGLFLSCIISNVYGIYEVSIQKLAEMAPSSVLINVLYMLLVYGIVPSVICFVCALVMYQISYRRFVRYISRNDFCMYAMGAIAIAYTVNGILDVFSILQPSVHEVVSALFDVTVLFGTMLALFFVIFVRKYKPNPVEKSNSFILWSTVVMVVLGISVIAENGFILAVCGNLVDEATIELLKENGYVLSVGDLQKYTSIVAIAVYIIDVIVVVALSLKFKKNANAYRNPETREDYVRSHPEQFGYSVRDDVHSTFGDDFSREGNQDRANRTKTSNSDDKVFDEFDI